MKTETGNIPAGLTDEALAAIASCLDDAAVNARAVAQVSARHPLSIADAYSIQRLLLDTRLARGEKLVGAKMGLTSRAKMAQVNVDQPIFGFLTDAMQVLDGGFLALGRLIHPRVEPEVAFLLGADLCGDTIGLADAYRAVAAVAPALEVIDSRYENFVFDLGDVIADNCSGAAFAVGPWSAPVTLAERGMLLHVNGRTVQGGTSSAILGDPLRSLVLAGRLAAAAGIALRAGMIVLAGASTAAVPLEAAHIAVEVAGLGRASFSAAAP